MHPKIKIWWLFFNYFYPPPFDTRITTKVRFFIFFYGVRNSNGVMVLELFLVHYILFHFWFVFIYFRSGHQCAISEFISWLCCCMGVSAHAYAHIAHTVACLSVYQYPQSVKRYYQSSLLLLLLLFIHCCSVLVSARVRQRNLLHWPGTDRCTQWDRTRARTYSKAKRNGWLIIL